MECEASKGDFLVLFGQQIIQDVLIYLYSVSVLRNSKPTIAESY